MVILTKIQKSGYYELFRHIPINIRKISMLYGCRVKLVNIKSAKKRKRKIKRSY